MSDSLQTCLTRLQDDYTRRQGTPFKHFFCPILWADEKAELCMGHVVNRAFGDMQIVQRKDVDGFYGSIAESEFQAFLECRDRPVEEVISNPKLSKEIYPTVDGEKVDYYPYVGQKSPDHTRVRIEGRKGASTEWVLKMPPSEAAAAQSASLGVNWDCTAPGLASLIKAAHLTMFHLMGYSYALSAAGEYVGHQILGRFYLENRGKPGKEVKRAAEAYFSEFVNMVRPIYGLIDPIKGTVSDNRLHFWRGSSGKPFGMGILVRLNKRLFEVLVPAVPGDSDTLATYLDFLRNDYESVVIEVWYFNRNAGRCEFSGQRVQRTWPKRNVNHNGG
jgi:hypothetical protein